ncbi:recombinase family protein [Kocuria sp. JC486]|uniref:recombinase family protein n=1 Tax=Kocuria sp. JC486 TaxID=1970736 RepID=UPI001424952D|nr:recombinase family protein [Kocuria sp. JC486]NHU85898.1 recombinase family protein [Kocuria sp. JC486]
MDLSKAAVVYTRISRDASGDGEGVDRQEHLCRELANRLQLDVVAVYSDNDIGASERTSKKKVRTGFNEMISAAHRKEFAHILAYSNSRLTRRMCELEDLIQLHEQTCVLIRTVVSGEDDLSTGDGRMVARIKASVDAAESDRISERQQAALLHNAQAGKPKLQHQRPFGWKKDGVTLEPEEAERMRDAVKKIKQGV